MSAIDRLLSEFEAQDCGTMMKVFRDGVHTLVATFSDELQQWLPTNAGLAMLEPKTEAAPEVPTQEVKPKNIKIAKPKDDPDFD